MQRPSFQFYPGDWQRNSNLRRCTHEEKGIWIDVMCVLHDQDEYGVVRWPLDELAAAVGTTAAKLKGLIRKGVLKGGESDVAAHEYVPMSGRREGNPVVLIPAQSGPLWYSSRMVDDEHVRHSRGGKTRFDRTAYSPHSSPDQSLDTSSKPHLSPHQPHGLVTPTARVGDELGDGPSSSSSSSSSNTPKSPPSGDLVEPEIDKKKWTPRARGDNPRAVAAAAAKAERAAKIRAAPSVLPAKVALNGSADRLAAACRVMHQAIGESAWAMWFADAQVAAVEPLTIEMRSAFVAERVGADYGDRWAEAWGGRVKFRARSDCAAPALVETAS